MKWSRWLTWLGVAIAVAGIVLAVWLELSIPDFPGGGPSFESEQRLQFAMIGISVVGAGALLAVAAQIMGLMLAKPEPQLAAASGITVAELSEP